MSVSAMPTTVVDTGALPVLFAAPSAARTALFGPVVESGRHREDNPNGIPVAQIVDALGAAPRTRAPRAHSAAQVGHAGWRVAVG